VYFALFGINQVKRRIVLPDKWVWSDVLDAGLFVSFDGDVESDVANWRGWLSSIAIESSSPASERQLVPRSVHSSWFQWVQGYMSENLPEGFAGLCPTPPGCSGAAYCQTYTFLAVVMSACAANTLNYSDDVVTAFDVYKSFYVAECAWYWTFNHGGTAPDDAKYVEWGNLFTSYVNTLQPPVFRWFAELCIDLRIAHSLWKQLLGGLPSESERVAFYESRWPAREWASFLP